MAAVEEEGIEEEPHALALVGNVLAAGVQVEQVPVQPVSLLVYA
jgi:hypothetical protein